MYIGVLTSKIEMMRKKPYDARRFSLRYFFMTFTFKLETSESNNIHLSLYFDTPFNYLIFALIFIQTTFINQLCMTVIQYWAVNE